MTNRLRFENWLLLTSWFGMGTNFQGLGVRLSLLVALSNANSIGAVVVNGKGGYLIPGLIDSHVHLTDCAYLSTLQKYGVTTALDMGTYPYDTMMNCHDHGVTDVRGSGAAGTVNGTRISLIPGFPTVSFILTPDAGKAFVAARRAGDVDHIKLFLDPLGPDDATIEAGCDVEIPQLGFL